MAGQPTPQGQVKPPNINQLAAQGVQGAGMGTVAGMNYSPLSVSGSKPLTHMVALDMVLQWVT